MTVGMAALEPLADLPCAPIIQMGEASSRNSRSAEGHHPPHPRGEGTELEGSAEVIALKVGMDLDDLLDRHARGKEGRGAWRRGSEAPGRSAHHGRRNGRIRSSLDIETQVTDDRASPLRNPGAVHVPEMAHRQPSPVDRSRCSFGPDAAGVTLS